MTIEGDRAGEIADDGPEPAPSQSVEAIVLARAEVFSRLTFTDHHDSCPANHERVRDRGACTCGSDREANNLLDALIEAVRREHDGALSENDEITVEAIRKRASGLVGLGPHYRDDVRFLLDRLERRVVADGAGAE